MTKTVADLAREFENNARAKTFVRWAKSQAAARGARAQALAHFRAAHPLSKHLALVEKAAVSALDTGSSALVAEGGELADAFLRLIRPRTVLGRLSGARRVPFHIKVPISTAMATAAWRRHGQPLPVINATFGEASLAPRHVGGIIITTRELADATDPVAEAALEADLTAGTAEASDLALLDPTNAGDEATPAAITAAATEVASTGSSADEVEGDVLALLAALVAEGVNLTAPYLVTSPGAALFMASLRSLAGDRVFPNVGPNGGDIIGVPLLTSASAGAQIVALDAAELLVADGGVDVRATEQATVAMADDGGTQDAATGTGDNLVSLWQANLVGLRVTRTMNWQMRRAAACARLSGFTYEIGAAS